MKAWQATPLIPPTYCISKTEAGSVLLIVAIFYSTLNQESTGQIFMSIVLKMQQQQILSSAPKLQTLQIFRYHMQCIMRCTSTIHLLLLIGSMDFCTQILAVIGGLKSLFLDCKSRNRGIIICNEIHPSCYQNTMNEKVLRKMRHR